MAEVNAIASLQAPYLAGNIASKVAAAR